MYRVYTYIGALLLLVLFPIMGNAATLQWDRNSESDMKEYKIYSCTPNPTCTVLQTLAARLGTILQTAVGVIPSFPLPPLTEGKVAVSAIDISGNESGLSVSIPFDAKSPLSPVNPRLVP